VGYQNLPINSQFEHLIALFQRAPNAMPVRDALVNTAASFGVQMPLSDPQNRALPAAPYQGLSNDQRWALYENTFRAIEAMS
jgi:hypothetical protein